MLDALDTHRFLSGIIPV